MISENYNHNLISFLPDDASFQIIRFLDDKSLRVFSVASIAFRTYIEQQQESLYSQAARETQRTYHHLIGLFGSLQGYSKIPICIPQETLQSQLWQPYDVEGNGTLVYYNRVEYHLYRESSREGPKREYLLYFHALKWATCSKPGTYTKRFDLAQPVDVYQLKLLVPTGAIKNVC